MYRLRSVCFVLLLSLACPAQAATIRITVEEPSGVERQRWPVTSGIPLAHGVLKDVSATVLFSDDGQEVPLQTEALARWPDGSIRWLLLDFQVDLAARQKKVFSLRHGPDVRRAAIDKPLLVSEEDDSDGAVVIDTGPMRMELSPRSLGLLGAVWLDIDRDGELTAAEQVARPQDSRALLIDASGREFRSRHDASGKAELVVEQAGPLRACVRTEGHYVSEHDQMFRYVVRIHAFRGCPFVRCYHTFVNDYQQALMAQVRELSLGFGPPRRGDDQATELFGVLDGKLYRPEDGSFAHGLFQWDENHYDLNGRTTLRAVPSGGRAPGWAALGNERVGLAVGLREFWQNWPKSISISSEGISVGICPPFPAELYAGKPLEEENKLYYQLRDGMHTFKVGVAKTHELWTTFFAGKPDLEELSDFFQAAEGPLLATCEPSYVSSTKAAGEFPPACGGGVWHPRIPPTATDKYFGYDAWLDRALEAHLKRREQAREYGMLNYGDWYGERSVNWGNLEYDLAHGLFLQYLRTADRRFFLRAEQAARHHIDVDVVHATNPHLKNPWGPPARVGEIWLHCLNHTGGYYEDAPLPVSRTYQMGHSTNFGHVWVSGDLDYYYLTGDRRAREVAVQIADAMVHHMPTAYGTHIRALGWPMILVLHAYEAFGDKKYLEAATKNWEVLKENIDWEKGWVVRLAGDHCKHGDRRCYGNVPFMEGLTLCALCRYHRVTGDPDVLRAITVGIDQMIRECWQEDVKTFRYTACPLSSKTPYALFMLSVEAMAYEAALTGNKEHLRILREGFRAAVPMDDGCHFGKSLAQMIHFTPGGLSALED